MPPRLLTTEEGGRERDAPEAAVRLRPVDPPPPTPPPPPPPPVRVCSGTETLEYAKGKAQCCNNKKLVNKCSAPPPNYDPAWDKSSATVIAKNKAPPPPHKRKPKSPPPHKRKPKSPPPHKRKPKPTPSHHRKP